MSQISEILMCLEQGDSKPTSVLESVSQSITVVLGVPLQNQHSLGHHSTRTTMLMATL